MNRWTCHGIVGGDGIAGHVETVVVRFAMRHAGTDSSAGRPHRDAAAVMVAAGGPDDLNHFLIPINITENTLRRGFAPPSGVEH